MDLIIGFLVVIIFCVLWLSAKDYKETTKQIEEKAYLFKDPTTGKETIIVTPRIYQNIVDLGIHVRKSDFIINHSIS